jgi:hypothetical protein
VGTFPPLKSYSPKIFTLTPTTILHMRIAHSLWPENTIGITPLRVQSRRVILTHHGSLTNSLTSIRIVHQHSAFIDRLHLQRPRSLWKRPYTGGKGSIRCGIHVHQPRFEHQPFHFLLLIKVGQIPFRILSASFCISGHRTLQRGSMRGGNVARQRTRCRLSEYRYPHASCRGSMYYAAMLCPQT